jgi:hypothetical protein
MGPVINYIVCKMILFASQFTVGCIAILHQRVVPVFGARVRQVLGPLLSLRLAVFEILFFRAQTGFPWQVRYPPAVSSLGRCGPTPQAFRTPLLDTGICGRPSLADRFDAHPALQQVAGIREKKRAGWVAVRNPVRPSHVIVDT